MMKRIILGEVLKKTEIYFRDVGINAPIFSKSNGVVDGFLYKNLNEISKPYIHLIKRHDGAAGFYRTLSECIKESQEKGYEFFIDQGGVHKKIILEERKDIIHFSKVEERTLIFARKAGSAEISGVVIKEEGKSNFNGWVMKIGGVYGAYGNFNILEDCIRVGKEKHDLEFFIED